MPDKPNILVIVDYSRLDYLKLLEAALSYCNFTLLFYSSPAEEKSIAYRKYGLAIYWKDFTDADALLSAIQPAKVLFFYIESYTHVVLNLACRKYKIPTFLLEHGLRADYVAGFDPVTSPPLESGFKDLLRDKLKIATQLGPRIKTRFFLSNTIRKLSQEDAAFMRTFVKVRKKHNYLETFREIKSQKRVADYYISFSPKIFEIHKIHDAVTDTYPVFFIGVPYFDHLANLKSVRTEKALLLIDQPLAEQGLLQWDKKYKQLFIRKLLDACSHYDFKLYIKPHPKQDLELWLETERKGKCTVLDDEQLATLAPKILVVLGFYSTYLMPFAAFDHVTLLTYENHPAGILNVSKPFIEAGVTHPVYDFEELNWALGHIDELHQKQLPNKAKFAKEWLYKFDGKAGERLRDILLSKYI